MKLSSLLAVLLAGAVYADGMKSGSGDTLPATCAVGDIFSITAPPRGVYDCVAVNTWRAQGFGISCTSAEYVMGDGSCQSGGGVGGPVDWADIENKPATFPPEAHSHAASDVSSGTLAAARLPNPGASSIGGVRSLTCSGNDKLSAIGTDGIPVCSTDQTGAGSPAWGSITGTLSNQTDLQTALNGKEAAGAFSGVGACSANQWASTLNDGGAPTCTQPAFSNLSGSVTDSQVPDTITVALAATATALAANPADCSTSTHFAVGVDASGVAVCEAIADADVPNNITVDLATLATTATTANAGDSATAFFPSGALEVARGGTGAAPGADDQVLVADSTSAATWRALNDCQGTGKALTYTASSNTWGCNTISGGGGGGPVIVRKAADQASTSTSFADVSGLTFSVSAATSYSFECVGSYTTAATTTALQLSVTVPASPTALRYQVDMSTTATGRHNSSQSAGDTVVNPASGAGATALPWRLFGTLENGANAGNLTLRMRSEVSASAATILRGAYCLLY